MGFYVSEKVEYKYGLPSFEFVSNKHYFVFPKEEVFKTWNEQDVATEIFRRKMYGLSRSKELKTPFVTAVWHQNKNNFDVIPIDKILEFKKRLKEQRERSHKGEQLSLDLKEGAVFKTVLDPSGKKIYIPRERMHEVFRQRARVHQPEKGKGSYRRERQKREWRRDMLGALRVASMFLASNGQRDIMKELVRKQRIEKGQEPGKIPEEYVGGWGEVRRWQQNLPSGQDPEQFDIVRKIKENPEPIKKESNQIIPDSIKEAFKTLKIKRVKGTLGGKLDVTVEAPLAPEQVAEILRQETIISMEGDGKNITFSFDLTK